MATTQAQKKATAKYYEDRVDRLYITGPKGLKEEIQTIADSKGESINAYVLRAINDAMKRDKQ